MLPPELVGITEVDVIEVIGEECLETNPNIEDYFKVLIWIEDGNFMKYRVTDRQDNRRVFMFPGRMPTHAEALYFIVKDKNPNDKGFETATITFTKSDGEWRFKAEYTYN